MVIIRTLMMKMKRRRRGEEEGRYGLGYYN